MYDIQNISYCGSEYMYVLKVTCFSKSHEIYFMPVKLPYKIIYVSSHASGIE